MKIKGYFKAKVKGLSEEDWFGYEFDGNKLFFSEKYINLFLETKELEEGMYSANTSFENIYQAHLAVMIFVYSILRQVSDSEPEEDDHGLIKLTDRMLFNALNHEAKKMMFKIGQLESYVQELEYKISKKEKRAEELTSALAKKLNADNFAMLSKEEWKERHAKIREERVYKALRDHVNALQEKDKKNAEIISSLKKEIERLNTLK